MLKKLFKFTMTLAALLQIGSAHAAEGPLWMRYSKISPDGKQITTNPGEYRDPIFCGNGKMVFLSERDGGKNKW